MAERISRAANRALADLHFVGAAAFTIFGGLRLRSTFRNMASAWGAGKAWGAGDSCAGDRARLPKGQEPCHICSDSQVEVILRPCKHEMCWVCCSKMRQNIVLKVGARGDGQQA